MKTLNTITVVVFLFLFSFIGHASAMTFGEYEAFLVKHDINLTTKQRNTIKSFFEKNTKNNIVKEKSSSVQTTLSSKKVSKTDFAELSYILKKDITDIHSNGAVSKLQHMLTNAGFPVGTIDGHYGKQTIKGLEGLKKSYTITHTPYGIFDPRDFAETDILQNMTMFLGTDEVFFYSIPKPKTGFEHILCADKKIEIIESADSLVFPLTFPYGDETPFTCEIKTRKKSEIFLTVHKKENKKETSYTNITVSKNYSTPNPKNDLRAADEKVMLADLYEKYADDKAYFNTAFTLPIESELISPYGKTRIMNGVVSSFHTGTDWRSRSPEPIHATNDGVVMFTGNLFYCGNTVIINHGLDIFTIYCHLSKTQVQTGDIVDKDSVIGETGATGRVSGAHLHVSSKFKGKYMDFMSIYNNSQILNK